MGRPIECLPTDDDDAPQSLKILPRVGTGQGAGSEQWMTSLATCCKEMQSAVLLGSVSQEASKVLSASEMRTTVLPTVMRFKCATYPHAQLNQSRDSVVAGASIPQTQ